MPPDGVGQRLQQRGGLADPVGQRGAVQIEAFAVEDLALPVERQVIGVLADQHMGEQARAGTATFDRARWQRRLREAVAAGAGHPRAHDPVHDEAAGDVFQLLGHILADPAQLAAAIGALRVAGNQFRLDARNMVRDRPALRLVGGRIIRQVQPRGHRGDGDLAHLQGASCNCSAVSDDTPNRCARWPANWCRSFSIRHRLGLHFGQQKRGERAQF